MAKNIVYKEIASNKLKTYVVMGVFLSFVLTVSYLLTKTLGSGPYLTVIALFIAIVMVFGSFYFSDRMVLSMTGAREADRAKDFDLYTIVENLAIARGLPKPKVYVIEDPALNAFATGRDPKHAVICVTRGLLDRLERNELEGVIAHEISHVANYDIRLMAVVAVLVGMLAYLADISLNRMFFHSGRDSRREGGNITVIIGLVVAVITPILATLIQLAISRRREYLADASAALITRNPVGLADALLKISSNKQILRGANNAIAHLFISNPFKNKEGKSFMAGLFNTHPPIEERIRILKSM